MGFIVLLIYWSAIPDPSPRYGETIVIWFDLLGMAGFLTTGFDANSWLSEAKDIFSDKQFQQKKYLPSFHTAFKDLTQIYKEQITSWWEVQSLDNYLKNNIVPRGLRISLLPAARARNPGFLTKWEQEATNSSLRLMRLLLDEERNTLETLKQKLAEQIEVVQTFSQEAEFANKEKFLQNTLEKYQYHLKERKHRQFVRDLSDFKENRIYSAIATRREPNQSNTEQSSTETDQSDSERDLASAPGRKPSRGTPRRGRQRGNYRGRGSRFLGQTNQTLDYSLRSRTPTPPN